MSIYLDKFRSTVPKTQGNQVLKILQQEQRIGQLNSFEAFKNRLKDLTTELQSTTIVPILRLFLAEYGLIVDSETFNFMVERIVDDLNTAFTEASNVDEILNIHNTLFMDAVFKSMYIALHNLENKISTFEFLNNDDYGWDNTHTGILGGEAVKSAQRDDSNAALIFQDPRKGSIIEADQDASIDSKGPRLSLGPNAEKNISLIGVRAIFDASSSQSEFDISIPENKDINNVIDGRIGTYWQYSVLTNEPKSNGITFKIEVDLGARTTYNYITIEPASKYPLILEKVSIRNPDTTLQAIPLPTKGIILDEQKSLFIEPQATNQFVFEFRQKNYDEIQFEQKAGRILEAQRGAELINIDLDDISEHLREILSSHFLREDIVGLPATQEQQPTAKFYEYQVGLDNIRIKHSTYDSTSIQVDKRLDLDKLALVGINASEKRPLKTNSIISYSSNVYPVGDSSPVILGQPPSALPGLWSDATNVNDLLVGSIEYWVSKIDFSTLGRILRLQVLPLLPTGANIVLHERFLPKWTPYAGVNTEGILRFWIKPPTPLTQVSILTTDDFKTKNSTLRKYIRVYKNGTEIPPKDEFLTSEPGWYLDSGHTNNTFANGTPMRTAIRVEQPSPTDIYTISYVPTKSNVLIKPIIETASETTRVDMTGDGSTLLTANNAIAFIKETISGEEIVKSQVYLSIILRRNTALQDISPFVTSYTLLTGRKDLSRFETGGL